MTSDISKFIEDCMNDREYYIHHVKFVIVNLVFECFFNIHINIFLFYISCYDEYYFYFRHKHDCRKEKVFTFIVEGNIGSGKTTFLNQFQEIVHLKVEQCQEMCIKSKKMIN